MRLLHTPFSRLARARAFTIIEIAICLGIIGFALVAIIAALPRGLDVQKRNREETIIGQDAEVWMNAIRNGARGFDDLTNYVLCITNFWTTFDANNAFLKNGFDYYTPVDSEVTSITGRSTGDFPLNNGAHIVGLLSMPKRIPNTMYPPYQSNYVIAYVRAFSGPVVDKTPQTNPIILSGAFTYRMIVENFPYAPIDTNSIRLDSVAVTGLSSAQLVERTNLLQTVLRLQANAHDFRLRFRWPVLPNGEIPNYGLATFRSMTSGELLLTNDLAILKQPLYFVQSGTFVTTNSP